MKSNRLVLSFVLTILVALTPSLSAQDTGAVTGTVSDAATKAPLPGVSIFVQGSQVPSSTDAEGRYTLSLTPGSHILLFHIGGYAAGEASLSVTAGGSHTQDITLTQDALFTEEIVVVGTRRTDRTVIESPVPIDVIPAQELQQSGGMTEINQILEMLVPSFNFPRPTITDGTDHIRPATLRGLSPDQTLVLVNGKRRHSTALLNVNGSVGRGSSAVDLNSIPVSAIERIEVLRDGAAAQYGSDAIAGVINVILKSGNEGNLSVSGGETADGDGQVLQAEAGYGTSFQNGGFVHLSGEYRHRDPTNRSGADPRQQYFTLEDGSPDPREATFDRINHRRGDAEVDDVGLFLNSSLPLSKGSLFYLFGSYGYRNGESGGFYRRALDNRTVRAIYPDGFLPLIESKVQDGSLALGVKGTAGEWLWDLSTIYGTNSFDFHINNSANVSLGTASPTDFDAGELTFEQSTTNLDISRAFDLGLASPLNLALGLEYRREGYKIQAGEPASYIDGGVPILDGPNAGAQPAIGSQVFPGFRPSDETDSSRDNVAVYIDLEADLSEKFTLALAGRFEDYSDFGSTAIGKLAMRYAPNETFALRGAVSTGFRAPSMAQSFYSTSSTVFIDGDPFEVRTFPVSSPAAVALGAKPLDAEESFNVSAGFALHLSESFYLTIDFYSIEIDDRIVLSENLTGNDIRDVLESNGIFGSNGGRFFTNAIDTETEGVDLVARYAHNLASGAQLRVTAGLNVNDIEVTRVSENPPELDGLNKILFGRSERGRIEEGQPEDKVSLAINYDHGKFGVMARTIRFGEVTSRNNSNPARDQTFSAQWITDLDLSYELTENLTLSVGGTNILDVYPDESIAANSFNGIFTYSGLSPFGFNGAYYYARLSVKFH
jgi:iron complex outermembrane receptor protein